MNVTVEELAPCRKLVRVEVDPQAVDQAYDKVTSEFQREVRLPGFRSGKAPRDMVIRGYSRQIDDEVKKKLISECYRKAIDEQKLDVLGYPDIEEIQFGRGQSLQFAATVEIVPAFEVPEYKGMEVRRETSQVTDEDENRAMDVLRERHSTYNDISRPVQEGDFVVVNYQGTTDGKPLTDIAPTAKGLTEQKNFWVEVRPGSFIPGFSEQLVGAQAGEKRTVQVEFPQDFVAPQLAGLKGVYEVEIVQVKEKALPELNDAFAQNFGAENVEKLREGVRADLQNELNFKQRRSVRNQLVRSLLNRVQFELPESIVMAETRNVVYDIVRENQQRGVPKEAIDQQKDEIFSAANSSARDRLKATFLLSRIAEKEAIQVTQEEITQRILALAQQYQIKPEKMVKQLKERNGIAQIHEQILSSKVIDFLENNAKVLEDPVPAAP